MIRSRDRFLRAAHASCAEVQQATLRRLLQLNEDSVFSRQRSLHSGLSADRYRECLPISEYDDYVPYIESMRRGSHGALLGSDNRLLMFALSSGTTASAKLIPITSQFVSDYRRGWQHWGISAHQDHPSMRHLRMVQLTSRHDQWTTEDGTPCGSISGLVTAMQRRIVRRLYAVPAAVSRISDSADRRHAVARFAFADPHVGMLITANPSTLLQLLNDVCPETVIRDIRNGTLTCHALAEATRQQLQPFLRPNRRRARELERILDASGRLHPSDCWPRLICLGVWSGGSAGTYLQELRESFGELNIRDHGLHASEGRMTIPIRDQTAEGVLDIESHFFEFVPADQSVSSNPETRLAHELEAGADYFILLTTSSGLYRYNIHDVVRCTGFHGSTPLLEFRHKGAHISSITGEKISETQVVESVTEASHTTGIRLTQFTVTPEWGTPPHYRLFVETRSSSHSPSVLQQLATVGDRQLCDRNCEYNDKRKSGRLGPLQCELLPASAWRTFRQHRLSTSGGSPEQYKHPCLLPDETFEERFRTAAGLTRLKRAS